MVFQDEEEEKVYSFPSADPYLAEDEAFLQAVMSGDISNIQSSYADAAKTYQLSWDVRRSSELSRGDWYKMIIFIVIIFKY